MDYIVDMVNAFKLSKYYVLWSVQVAVHYAG
jgi:hypothetical protein